MHRDVVKTKSFSAARDADIAQQHALSVEERRAAARELKRRAYGEGNPDVREYEQERRQRGSARP